MPIKGLTGETRWPRFGTLRKGAPMGETVRNGKTIPVIGKDLDDRLRFEGVDESVAESWVEAFGSAVIPAELVVVLPYETVDECWQAWREHWVAGGLRYRCDGEKHVLWLDAETGEYRHDAVACPGNGQCEAKPVGRLEVSVPQLGRMGTVTVLTTSGHDIKNLDGAIRILSLKLGGLTGIPVRLTRVLRRISTPAKDDKGKPIRVRREKWLLHIEALPEWSKRMLLERALDEPLLASGPPALPAPPDDDIAAALVLDMTLAPPAPDFGDTVGFTERIDACGTEAELDALTGEIDAIDELARKANVWRLWWRRYVLLADRAASSATAAQLATIAAKLASVPADTAGLDDARSHLGARRDELIEAGVIERPAAAQTIDARQPALVG